MGLHNIISQTYFLCEQWYPQRSIINITCFFNKKVDPAGKFSLCDREILGKKQINKHPKIYHWGYSSGRDLDGRIK
jgi:hypothetical protein